jgi:hypothetical protein
VKGWPLRCDCFSSSKNNFNKDQEKKVTIERGSPTYLRIEILTRSGYTVSRAGKAKLQALCWCESPPPPPHTHTLHWFRYDIILCFFVSVNLFSTFFSYLLHFRFSSFVYSSLPPSFLAAAFISSFFLCFFLSAFHLVFVRFLYLLILFIWPLHAHLTRMSNLCLLIRTLFTDALTTIHTIYHKK